MRKISKDAAEHYLWGGRCHAWRLVDAPGLSVNEERMPSGASEVRHHHQHARQFFFVLEGEAVIEAGDERHALRAFEGLEVPPGAAHRVVNEGGGDLRFLVISAPHTRGDRVE